ncbi:Neutral and basic amino acid transport protein rBAT [Fasciola hepatica]|uniref:Neutral and basic amino acid transport protein rBAT n=1 Tax=Fasciola hepatica TaxID=6192 RepID=A0A4E0RG73_FASHE|nr:Neutral and basic amino acid transport protein rBAT [Fasciola hepatica]
MIGDANCVTDETVGFLPARKHVAEGNKSNTVELGVLLTRDDLMKVESEEPCWRRARYALFIIFWIVWLALLATAIVVIVFTPKCPPRPKLEFWQSKTAYWVDPFAFKDSDSDMIGDLRGLTDSMSYIKDTVGAGYVILGSFLSGYFTNSKSELGLIDNLNEIDRALGTMDDFRSLVKSFHRGGLEIVITLDFNSVSLSHPWAVESSLLKRAVGDGMFSRDGRNPFVEIGGEEFYSVSSANRVDLNLQSEEVIRRLLDVVKFWIAEGIDGILLSDVAFYVEEENLKSSSVPVNPEVNKTVGLLLLKTNKWFSKYPSNQIFTNGSVEFVKLVRKTIEEASKRTAKKYLLAVDPGDIGYGLQDGADKALMFLGTDEHPAADLIISRQFVSDRGWKATPTDEKLMQKNIESYDLAYSKLKSKLGLVVSTPSDQRHSDVLSLASIFLLPGSPIVYYGSELATFFTPKTEAPRELFPLGKVPFPNLSNRDSALTCHLPMPWGRSGQEFSAGIRNKSFERYLQFYGVTETVESSLSVGRISTPLRLVQKLMDLRKVPSILWGKFEILKLEFGTNETNVELFLRKAEQFPSVIVALISPTSEGGFVYDFSSVCEYITPRVVHPPKEGIFEGVKVKSKAVYLDSAKKQSVYVFECS